MAQEPQQYWLIFQSDQIMLLNNDSVPLLTANDIQAVQHLLIRQYFIGHFQHADCFCAELAPQQSLPQGWQATKVRRAFDILGHDWYSIASKAYAILNWDKTHQYCGRCSHATQPRPPQFERYCPNCQLTFYPRISPSIIVRINKGAQLLMARSAHFPVGSYALIAGFVEAGETVEAAVHREVYEEVGITIKNLKYIASQPWPFPDSLMLGFSAEYAGGELTFHDGEIEDANWYDVDNLPGRPSSTISIASQLINDFVQQHRKLQQG